MKKQDENEEKKKDIFYVNVSVENKFEWDWIIWKEIDDLVWVVQEQSTEWREHHFTENEKKCTIDVIRNQAIHIKIIDEDE